jgi:hypothetical protein
VKRLVALLGCALGLTFVVAAQSPSVPVLTKIEISYPAPLNAGPFTGRVLVAISRNRSDLGFGGDLMLGVDVEGLEPGRTATIDQTTLGYPINLGELPPGDYDVEALLHRYTRVQRKDGHVLWLPMESAPDLSFAPGNLISPVQRVRLDLREGFTVRLQMTRAVSPRNRPPDTASVKRVEMQSRILSEFWGHPMKVGATVLLPRDFDSEPTRRYPAVYGLGCSTAKSHRPQNRCDRTAGFGDYRRQDTTLHNAATGRTASTSVNSTRRAHLIASDL